MNSTELKTALISIADAIDEVKANFPHDFIVAFATFLESPDIHQYSGAASLLLNIPQAKVEKEIPLLAQLLRKADTFFTSDSSEHLSEALLSLANRPLILRLVAQLLQ
jgi:hypothetical protein